MCGSVVGQRGALLEWEEVAEEAVTMLPRQIQGKDTVLGIMTRNLNLG